MQFLYDPGAGGWGTAQLTGAVHQARVGLQHGWRRFRRRHVDIGDTKYGWAVQGGVKFNLSMLGAGDTLYLQAAYAQGAASYLGAQTQANGLAGNSHHATILVASDAIAVGPAASIKLGQGYNVLAALDHYWTPNFDTAIWASYTRWDYNNGALTGVTLGAPSLPPSLRPATSTVWQVGAQATWVPVKGIKFAGTVNYYNVDRPEGRCRTSSPSGGMTLLRWQAQQRRHPGRASYPARLLRPLFSSQGELSPGAKAPGFLLLRMGQPHCDEPPEAGARQQFVRQGGALHPELQPKVEITPS